jgi:hypothetical protein
MDDSIGLEEYVISAEDISSDVVYILNDDVSDILKKYSSREIEIFSNETRYHLTPKVHIDVSSCYIPCRLLRHSFKVKQWAIPTKLEPLTIVCVGMINSGKSFIANRIYKNIMRPDLQFLYMCHRKDRDISGLYHRNNVIEYNTNDIYYLSLDDRPRLIIAESCGINGQAIYYRLENAFLRNIDRLKNTMYIQLLDCGDVRNLTYTNFDYLILHKYYFTLNLRIIYEKFELDSIFEKYEFFARIFSKITGYGPYTRMVIHLSSPSKKLDDCVFFLPIQTYLNPDLNICFDF